MHYFAANSAAGKSMRKAANAAYKIAKERRASKELVRLQLLIYSCMYNKNISFSKESVYKLVYNLISILPMTLLHIYPTLLSPFLFYDTYDIIWQVDRQKTLAKSLIRPCYIPLQNLMCKCMCKDK